MANPAYPDDFLGKLELFEFTEFPDGSRQEVWLSNSAIITCLWFASSERICPSVMHYKYV